MEEQKLRLKEKSTEESYRNVIPVRRIKDNHHCRFDKKNKFLFWIESFASFIQSSQQKGVATLEKRISKLNQ